MVVEVLKAKLGMGSRRRRYRDIESVRDLEEVSDPETKEDSSKKTLRDTFHEHPYAGVIGGVVALVAAGLFLMYLTRFAPGVLSNKWTWIGIGAVMYTATVYRRGWRARDERVTEYDELTLKMNGDQTTYKGSFIDLGGRAPAFIPIKGWERWGYKARPYLNADLGASMVESIDQYKMNSESPAVIRLEPGENGDLLSMSDSDWGGKHITQETSGLEPDPHGNQTSLYATFPDYEDERANSLAAQLKQVTDDYYDAVDEVESLVRRNRNLKDRLKEPIEDEVDNRIQQFQRMASAGDRRKRTQEVAPKPRQDDWRGTGSLSANGTKAESEVEQVEEELSTDDD